MTRLKPPKAPRLQATSNPDHHDSQPREVVNAVEFVDHTEQLALCSKRTRRHVQKLAKKKRTSTAPTSFKDMPFELLDAILLCCRPRDLVVFLRVSKGYREFIRQEGPRIAKSIIGLRYPCLEACFLRPVLLEDIEDLGIRRHLGHPKVTNRIIHTFQNTPASRGELVCSCATCYHRWNVLGLLVDFADWQDHLDKGEPISKIKPGECPPWNNLLLARNEQIILKGIRDPLWYARILEKHLESITRAIRRQVLNKGNKRQHYRLTTKDIKEGTDRFLQVEGPLTIDYPHHRDKYYMLEAYLPNRSWVEGKWAYLSADTHKGDVSALINTFFPVLGGGKCGAALNVKPVRADL